MDFHVVPGRAITEILSAERHAVLKVVRETYLMHGRGETVNPESCFLRFPDRPADRGIALPAYLAGADRQMGIKWISSFPGNLAAGLPRATAVLILNDAATGYPVACLEGAQISAARTAASAAVATAALTRGSDPRRLAFVGTGVIARNILEYLDVASFPVSAVTCFDLDASRAQAFAAHAEAITGTPASMAARIEDALDSDVVVFATTAATPHLGRNAQLRPGQLVLNISLRDLAPELLLRASNVLDDVDHCLRAGTSPHLAEQVSGGRTFVSGTLADVLAGKVEPDPGLPVIFSPFGLGVLDVAVGSLVLAEAKRLGTAQLINDFF
ncbi:MAG TPA: 2,3-diaminopropionate biosynthesis protein SbnB [Streptosporangiaceae bacterium]|jgi:N-[(2S)-2-amino-2-carboxyethyl]-L-glutamate dehydrogenase|nr:2,3-diaminopropionate biosynthesis protein SbnB [Streptosporangiaceae bacterium]